MNENVTKLTDEEIALKTRLDLAFSDMGSAQVIKKQYCPRGRKVFLPVMAALASVIFAITMYFSSLITMHYRIIVMPIQILVWLFFMVRFGISFITDIKTKKFAEKITFVTDADGKKFVVGEGNFVKKFEYEGGSIVMWGQDNYEKFLDSSSYSPLASKYSSHLQRRSSNYNVLNADFLFEQLRAGAFTVTDNTILSQNDGGSYSVKFDDKFIKSIYYVGKSGHFYDSASPIHVLDCFLPFNYVYSYTFSDVNKAQQVVAPLITQTAIKDYLMPEVNSTAVKFL